MANPGNYNTPDDTSLVGIIKKLQDRVDALEKLTRASSTSIDSGVFEVKSASKKVLWVFGDLAKAGIINTATGKPLTSPDGSVQMGVCAFRDTGELIFSAVNLDPDNRTKQNWALWDTQTHMVMQDDVISGEGLARPYIPMAFTPYDTSTWGKTQSATFVDMSATLSNKQHPRIFIDVLMYCDAADTSGQMRLALNGVPFGPTVSSAGPGIGYTLFPATAITLPTLAWGTNYTLTVQACRTAGTGNVKIAVRGCWGIQS